MPRAAKPLTVTQVDAAARKARERGARLRLADGGGLYLDVTPSGARTWLFRFDAPDTGKRAWISLGSADVLRLADARAKADAKRAELRAGERPVGTRGEATAASVGTFAAAAEEWLESADDVTAATRERSARLLRYVCATLGPMAIETIRPADVLRSLDVLRDRPHSAHKAKLAIGQVFAWANLHDRCEQNPTAALRGKFVSPQPSHHAAITDEIGIGQLLRAIDGYTGDVIVREAMKLLALTFVRSSELRLAEWTEIELAGSAPLWTIPAERMKSRRAHKVPLSRQAVQLLTELRPLTGHAGGLRGVGRLVFPGMRAERPLSEAAFTNALRAMGFAADRMTAHGFRSTASTRLNEMDFKPDLIEKQLAHVDQNKIRDAYQRSDFMNERRAMMQRWADECDRMKGLGRKPL